MSFGFGLSDFIAVLQLADKVRRRFIESPSQLQAISGEYVIFEAIKTNKR